MKLFGGGTPHQPKKEAAETQHRAPRPGEAAHGGNPAAPHGGTTHGQPAARHSGAVPGQPGGAPRPTAPKPVKTTLTKKQKRNRVLIIIIAVTLAIIAVMCAAAAMMMKPPSIAGSSKPDGVIRPEQNDATIHDAENGDEMNLDGGDALDVDMGNRREGVYTVLVCATDIDGTRTDAIMVATLDTVNDAVSVINIPRDLMSNCNRVGASKKINAAYGTRGGIETTKSEVKKVLGFTPDKYVVVSFDAIVEIIDALGGVDYEVPWRMKYDDPTQNLHIDFQPGMTHMDGQAAVEFMRWRKNNSGVSTGVSGYTGGDEERIEKDQEFLKFLAKEVFTITNVPRIPSLAQAVFSNVETDLTAGEVLWLAWQLYDVKNENINMMTLPGYGTMSYAGTGTMYSFYFPYRSQVLTMVNEFINPYEKAITSIDVVTGPTSAGSTKSSSGSSTSTKKEETEDDEEASEDDESLSGEGEESSSGGSNSGSSSGGSSGTEGSEDGNTPSDGSTPAEGGEISDSSAGEGDSDPEQTEPAGSSSAEPASEPAAPASDPGNSLEGLFAPGVTPDPPAES